MIIYYLVIKDTCLSSYHTVHVSHVTIAVVFSAIKFGDLFSCNLCNYRDSDMAAASLLIVESIHTTINVRSKFITAQPEGWFKDGLTYCT